MKIEGTSLIRYLCTALEHEMENSQIPKDVIDRALKSALSFSPEGWAAGFGRERSILDPSSVISRMFAVEVEKKMRDTLKRNNISNELPWVLRILDENGGWDAGEFLRYFGKECPGIINPNPLQEQYLQALQHFPILFEDSSGGNPDGKIIHRMERASKILQDSQLLHISHPKFHKEWSDLVGSEMEETKEGGMAKQHWSSVISHEIEGAVRGSDVGVVLQAVGGHVLIAVKDKLSTDMVKDVLKNVQGDWHLHVNVDQKNELVKKPVKELQRMCEEKGVKKTGNKSDLVRRLIGRGWSPSLWGSWDGGACGVPLLNDGMTERQIVSNLAEDYENDSTAREKSRLRWANFGWKTRGEGVDEAGMVMYLDVMGLGEKCWSKRISTYHCPVCGKQAQEWGFEQVDLHEVVLFNEWGQYEDEGVWKEVIDFENTLMELTGPARREYEGDFRPDSYHYSLEVPDGGIEFLDRATVFFKYRDNSPKKLPWYKLPIPLKEFDEEEFYEEWQTDFDDFSVEYREHLMDENRDILKDSLEGFIGDSIAYDEIIDNTSMDDVGHPEDTSRDVLNLRCGNPKCAVTLPSSGSDVGDDRIHFVPSRTRKQTIDGFSKSREMTAMIESTFGMVMAEMTPASILSMGGDEMIARISGEDDFEHIVDAVEKHSLKFHTDVLESEDHPSLLWWAMICKEDELGDLTKTGFKDTLRDYCTDWGSRFVNPMWPDFNV